MSSSIRPPGAPPSAPAGLAEVNDLKHGAPAEVQSARGAAEPQATAQAESASGAWLRRLEVGEVTRAQAVEGLVAQAVEAHGGARLSPAQRDELSQVLRAALLDDPVLSGLLDPTRGAP